MSNNAHLNLYKNYSHKPWKDIFRQRCHEQLRERRQKVLLTNRNNFACNSQLISSIVAEQWQLMQAEKKISFEFFNNCDELDDVDYVQSLIDEVQQELLNEEKKILEEQAQCSLHDEALIESLLSNEVVCPLCQKSRLLLNKGMFFCQCGLRINTEQDCITMDMVKHNLAEGTNAHSLSCTALPQFQVFHEGGADTLLMTCEACDFMFIIL